MFLRIAFNMSAFLDSEGRSQMRELKVHELVMGSMQSEKADIYVVASLCVANLIGHEENHPLLKSNQALVDELIKVLEHALSNTRYAGGYWYVWTPLQGLANLSVNDSNKHLLVESNSIPKVIGVLRDTTDLRALEYGSKILANVAFVMDLTAACNDIHEVLNGVLERSRSEASSNRIEEYVRLAVYQVKQTTAPASQPLVETEPNLIAVCCAPSHRQHFEGIKEFLERSGFQVWLGVHTVST